MSDGLNCLSQMRERMRVEIRKKRNEETFYKNRILIPTEYSEIMKYLESRNDDLQIPNLKEFIENRSQHFHECAQIAKWLLEYDNLEYSNSGIQIYLLCQNEIALNFESKYIKLSAKLLRKLSLKNEAALALCTKLSSHTTIRSQPFIQELQRQDFIIELIDSQFETVELICNLIYGESFVVQLFEKNQTCSNFLRAQLYHQRYSSQVILMFQSISYSTKICDLITTKELIYDLMQLNPCTAIFSLLIKLAQNTQIFYNYIDIQFIDYIMEMIDNKELQDLALKLIYIILVETQDLYLIVALQQSKKIIEQIAITQQLNEIANEILDLYINNS